MQTKSATHRLAQYLLEAKYAVALTGAGISTESGIPDFRGPEGLWHGVDPQDILSRDVLYHKPEVFYENGLRILQGMRNKKPNLAHRSLAWLEKHGFIRCVVTQNIDGLHLEAGSQRVIEVHGNLRTAYCDSCLREYPFETLISAQERGQVPLRCQCYGIVRPNVVLFGDPMPPCFEDAVKEAQKSDFMLVIGSSLQVAPVSYLPSLGEKVGIVNLEPTPYDAAASVVIREKAGAALSHLTRLLDAHLRDAKTPNR